MFDNLKKKVENLDAQRKVLEADVGQGEDRLLSFYVKIMPRLLDAERCSIFIHDPAANESWLKCGTGVPERKIQVPVDESIVGKVIKTGQVVIESGLDQKAGVHREVDEATGFVTRDLMCIPIKTVDGKGVAGAVQILNKKNGRAFDDQDRSMLEELAHFLELTIESIYVNQQSAGVMRDTLTLIGKLIYATITTFLVFCAVLALYWAALYMAG